MAANPPQMRMLSLDEAKAAVTKAAARFEELENKETIKQTIDAAGGDTVKVMQTLPAVALGIVKDVVEEYGFEGSVPGVMQFVMAINMHRADPEIADKVAQLQGKFMPTFQMPPPPGAQ